MIAKGEGDWGEDRVGGRGCSRCNLVYMKWINNKVLLCSTENDIQYPMIKKTIMENTIYKRM